MNIAKLYPEVSFPVSRATAMISPNIKWDHRENYFVPYMDLSKTFSYRHMLINLSDKKFDFVKDHVIDGRVLFPGTGWLFWVWETFGIMQGCLHMNMKVVFEDVKFLRATALQKNQDIIITISISRGKCFLKFLSKESTQQYFLTLSSFRKV